MMKKILFSIVIAFACLCSCVPADEVVYIEPGIYPRYYERIYAYHSYYWHSYPRRYHYRDYRPAGRRPVPRVNAYPQSGRQSSPRITSGGSNHRSQGTRSFGAKR